MADTYRNLQYTEDFHDYELEESSMSDTDVKISYHSNKSTHSQVDMTNRDWLYYQSQQPDSRE